MSEGQGKGGAVLKKNSSKQQEAEALITKNAANRKLIYNRAKKYGLYSKEYEEQQKELIQLNRKARLKGRFHINPEAKLLFVIRVPGINVMGPKSTKILQIIRLTQIFSGIFLMVSKYNINMLHKVEPYVTFGYPNLKSVRELINKRGYGNLNEKRTALTDDSIIEQALGKHEIHCIEDLIHEI